MDILNAFFSEITSVCRILRFFVVFSRCNRETWICRTYLCPGIYFGFKVIPSWMEKSIFHANSTTAYQSKRVCVGWIGLLYLLSPKGGCSSTLDLFIQLSLYLWRNSNAKSGKCCHMATSVTEAQRWAFLHTSKMDTCLWAKSTDPV